MSNVIEIKKLKKVYNANGKNPTVALRGIDFNVKKGDFAYH